MFWKRTNLQMKKEKKISEEFTKPLPKEIIDDIIQNQPVDIRLRKLFLTDEEFEKLKDPYFDLQSFRLKKNEDFVEIYRTIQDVLKNYIDMDEDYYPLVSAWIIGTYIHKIFLTYPYLYFNAMKGSGKTRTLSLISHLSYNGKMVVNMSEAVLFRTAMNSTICIDEFERIKGKDKANLRELLNSAYKRGISVERAFKTTGKDGERFEIEKFDVFCPIAMANISGMDEVLGDRSVRCLLERTPKTQIARKVEIWALDAVIKQVKEKLVKFSVELVKSSKSQKTHFTDDEVKSSVELTAKNRYIENLYIEWNNLLKTNYTPYTNNTKLHKTTPFLHKILKSSLNGRHLELFFPLFIISEFCGDLDNILRIAERIVKEKKAEDVYENRDISLIDFISKQEDSKGWINQKALLEEFKGFSETEEDKWMTSQWFGIALTRLNLLHNKRRLGRGVEVILNVKKAKDKIIMFK